MEYRSIGNTGMKASVVGLGTEHLDRKPYEDVETTIHTAMNHGVNIMDLFMPGDDVREKIGRAIAGRREDWIIQGHIGSVDLKEQYDISRDLPTCQRYFENLLRRLHTDYIDFGMLFFIDSEEAYQKVFEGDILPYVQKLKQQGTVRAIGASSHNPVVAKKVAESGVVDLMMFSINPAFDMIPSSENVLDKLDGDFSKTSGLAMDPVRASLYTLCEQKGVALTTMKTLGAGKLLKAEHSPFGKPMSVAQCIHYAVTRPAVASALVGCASSAQMEEALAYLDTPDEARDYAPVLENYQGNFTGSCVYCNHCLPCPASIDIATVNKYLDIAELDPDNVPPSIRQHYASLDAKGGGCIQCGSCEGKCPFQVPVIRRMARAATVFGA